ncbi:MAG: SAM-dependent methyltransferase [Gammaproteobacteria bacterium]|nr:MAG: SAM-dependent methyltransferase [Gammaproteobacteria bacterium]PIE36347.1 MAG: SAM-dependent methyltransferase [Gammaproteobacteria bacterium]
MSRKSRKAASKKKARGKHKGQRSGPSMAELADRHVLYQESVQNPEFESDFIDDTFRDLTGRVPASMREDFAGTAISSCTWVAKRERNTAVAVDIDGEVLDWGREHNVAALTPEQQSRVSLIKGDVLTVETAPVDVLQAYNFSYWIFKERSQMLEYFRRCHKAIKTDGLLFLDVFGGFEAYQSQKEKRKLDGFSYVWEQADFNAVTHEVNCAIHFRFPDKSKLDNAFTYSWRVWGAREIREVLADAGFRETIIYRQMFDEDTDEALDEYEPTDFAEDYACWLGYIVARP